jgi:Ni,Fe-hydrogenase III large subunit/Ni,Fe-hydrogenase III component G
VSTHLHGVNDHDIATRQRPAIQEHIRTVLQSALAGAVPEAFRSRVDMLVATLAQSAPEGSGDSPDTPSTLHAVVDAETLALVVPALHAQRVAYFCDFFAEGMRTSNGAAGPEEGAPNSRATGSTLHVILTMRDRPMFVHLSAPMPAGTSDFPSLSPRLPAAGWYERELYEEAGLSAVGHPRLVRLRLPAEWPSDTYPLLEDLSDMLEVSDARGEETEEAHVPLIGLDDERAVLDPGPEGVVDYPLGPVRSGVVESAHYTLRTGGEEIIDARLQLFFKHRGVEHRAVGLTPLHLPLLAERISGTSGFAHALAVCEALERSAGVSIPSRATYLRTFFAELERIYNHLGYQADVCQATGLVVGQAQFDMLKERVLRLNALLTGHRYLFGACIYGGLASDPGASTLEAVRRELHAIQRKADRLGHMALGSPSHVDRLERTGRLLPEDAQVWATVGPVGRASGVDLDLRRDMPYAAYGMVSFEVPVLQDGDALARVRVRLEEMAQSFHIVDQVLHDLPPGPISVSRASTPLPTKDALGWVESPRGSGLHWIRLDHDGNIVRYRVRTASFANAQAFALCIPGHNILTDFPVIEQSWGLSSAGADR